MCWHNINQGNFSTQSSDKGSDDYTPLYKKYYILYILNKPWKPNIW